MKEFNFNSQVCTDKNQSERLLALGLKKETADMCYKVTTHDFKGNEINEKDRHYTLCCWYDESSLVCGLERKETIPAWSLHRLLSLLPQSVKIGKNYYDLAIIQNEFVRLIDDIGDIYIYFDRDGIYESLLLCIEWLIKEGYFNKEYLV